MLICHLTRGNITGEAGGKRLVVMTLTIMYYWRLFWQPLAGSSCINLTANDRPSPPDNLWRHFTVSGPANMRLVYVVFHLQSQNGVASYMLLHNQAGSP